MSYQKNKETAAELVQALKMLGFSRNDAADIMDEGAGLIRVTTNEEWINPLTAAGMKIADGPATMLARVGDEVPQGEMVSQGEMESFLKQHGIKPL